MDLSSLINNVQGAKERAERWKNLNLTWNHRVGTIRQEAPPQVYSRGQAFYTSSYKCPKCGRFLYKAQSSIDFIGSDKKTIYADNVFACFDCQNLFAVEAFTRLGDGEYYIMDTVSKFYPAAEIIDITTGTANDLSQFRGF